ncbi:hypothetical protein PV963_37320 [Streptomyces coeruleorubidus]|uniref:NucA/NucB deoxyribonuclease domain-containing protein n=1 Tax=Streptomyces coeruleorubidus TaxID=116188 RepID=UPI00237FBA5B|nr:hypothetical protein [Streptomyces coeruleorubidus]WDV55614.1 hypothetical protein PV963_37320 [Streptomyces coeruleorubidus]
MTALLAAAALGMPVSLPAQASAADPQGAYASVHDAQAQRLVSVVPESAVDPMADDPYSFGECRDKAKLPGKFGVGYAFRNRFESCMVWRASMDVSEKPGLPAYGGATFRLTLLGHGQHTGGRETRFEWELDEVDPWGDWDNAKKAVFTLFLECESFGGAKCSSNAGVYAYPLADWKLYRHGGVFTLDASGSPKSTVTETGKKNPHHDDDVVSYHQSVARIQGNTWASGSHRLGFRCDQAKYISRGPGGCIFHQVDPIFHMAPVSNDAGEDREKGYPEIRKHIETAVDRTQLTYPRLYGKKIPGKVGTTQPLHRFYGKRTKETRSISNGSRTDVNRECRRYEAWRYSRKKRLNLECDEYPFAQTRENARLVNTNKATYPRPWSFSARLADGDQNGNHGRTLGAWMTTDHILEDDAFWIKLHDQPLRTTSSFTPGTRSAPRAAKDLCTHKELGGAYQCEFDMESYRFPNGTEQVWVIGPEGDVLTRWSGRDGSWSPWKSMSGVATSGVEVTDERGRQVRISVMGTDGNRWHNDRSANGTWSGWHR